MAITKRKKNRPKQNVNMKIKQQKISTIVMGACVAIIIILQIWHDGFGYLQSMLPDIIK
jgi:chemotaxis receptor (MCP) glutamine deamidase CheD